MNKEKLIQYIDMRIKHLLIMINDHEYSNYLDAREAISWYSSKKLELEHLKYEIEKGKFE